MSKNDKAISEYANIIRRRKSLLLSSGELKEDLKSFEHYLFHLIKKERNFLAKRG
jgi:hypothetical protein